jgi:hypothetical protein
MNWFEKISSAMIPMTAGEMKWAEFALVPMPEFWCTEEIAFERDGELYSEDQLPRIEGRNLILSDVFEINEDFLYRIEEQPETMGWIGESKQHLRPARNLAEKVRNVLGI